jgi:hypothetical protein
MAAAPPPAQSNNGAAVTAVTIKDFVFKSVIIIPMLVV